MSSSLAFMTKAHRLPIVFAVVYMSFVLSLTVPQIQRHMIFLHKINFPFFADFDSPENYGISPSKGRNLRLTTSDDVKIGAWHILPDVYHKEKMPTVFSERLSEDVFDLAVKTHPTVIYLHGNAANRAAPFRISAYHQITSRLSANVVAIDYRGFGDSDGVPDEEGLVTDARTAWNWVKERSADQKVMIMGQSLGTGVAAQLTEELMLEGNPPSVLAMIAPYASLRSQLSTFKIVGIFPVLGPISSFPGINRLFDYVLKTQFSTASVFDRLFSSSYANKTAPSTPSIIMTHATDDNVIPFSNSELLFEALVNRELFEKVGKRPFGDGTPASPANYSVEKRGPAGEKEFEVMREWTKLRDAGWKQIVQEVEIEKFGKVSTFEVGSGESGKKFDGNVGEVATVTLVRTENGGHNEVGEGAIDVIALMSQFN